ncbi:hypothetical protein MBAV_003138 [Candidatus Magnetobacterium bavaricum]|uniref:Uncharacterized protein n=1 Tax=Candidatus Magnetobacterium bavaricum TaxID=29290 RepID=A0A0F3GRT5_9BACT|nr:hypothetical protein MBAV_003138 [Candidatus Magnetobacterium bavaricum]
MYLEQYQRTKNLNYLASLFKNKALDLLLLAFGGGKGPLAEMSRITKLLKEPRILHFDCYAEDRIEGEWALPLPNDKSDNDTIEELTEAWSTRLRETKSKSRAYSLILDDAKVIARLEWMNNKMAKTGERIVLISGDSALHKAATGYSIDLKHTFADRYIREPKVFMASPKFLITNRQTDANTDLIGWLDVFLASHNIDSNDYINSYKEIMNEDEDKLLQEFIGKTPDCIDNLKRDWKELVDLTAIEYSFNSNEEQFYKLLKTLKKEGLAKVKEMFDSMTSKVWLDFWKVATVTGLESTKALEAHNPSKQALPLRGVPALCLSVNKDRVDYLCSTLRYQEVIDKKTSFDDMLKEDPSGYSAFLIHALAFGAKGRWNVSSILSRYAIDIANDKVRRKKIPDGHEPITGNEACYLLARSTRYTIKTSNKLSEIKEYMKEAKKRKLEATGKEFDLRYESELIGIDMTYHLFRIFAEEKIPDTVPGLSECQNKIIKLLENPEVKKKKDIICVTIQKQLIVYLFYALLLRQEMDKEPSIEQETLDIALRWLPEFDSILDYDSKEYYTLTCFTHPIYLAAKRYYTPKEQISQKVPDSISRDKIKDYYVMPYDKAFYGFLPDIIQGHIKSPY